MISPARDIKTMIEASGIDLTAWGVFVGTEPDGKDNVLTIYDTGGSNDNADAELETPNVMIRARGQSYADVYEKAQAVKRYLLNTHGLATETAHYSGFWLLTDIAKTHRDQLENEVFTFNLYLHREPIREKKGVQWRGGINWLGGVKWR